MYVYLDLYPIYYVFGRNTQRTQFCLSLFLIAEKNNNKQLQQESKFHIRYEIIPFSMTETILDLTEHCLTEYPHIE